MIRKTNNNQKSAKSERLRQIISILHKHEVTRGITPEKLRLIVEDMGPTFIKMGQIMSMRTDILPQSYCNELKKLHSEVTPLPLCEVQQVIRESCGRPVSEIFVSFNDEPLGSASIAQAHLAKLSDGSDVVVKVQRPGIYDTMAQDIDLLRRAAGILRQLGAAGGVIDFRMVLDELWTVAQEEMNFLLEAKNAEEFSSLNQDVTYTGSPHIFRQYTTPKMLVMEYIDGLMVSDREKLIESGYDPDEIGAKLADSYMKQVCNDGFFHADPHPGNLRIRGGQIVWIDFGMMGRLTRHDKEQITRAIMAVGAHDISTLKDVVMMLGECHSSVEQSQLYADLDDIVSRYGSMDLGGMNLSKVLSDLLEVAKHHKISMPGGFTLLVRGITTLEGVVADLAPDINLVQIAIGHLSVDLFSQFNWKKELKNNFRGLIDSGHKSLEIPSQISESLKQLNRGDTKLHIELSNSRSFEKTISSITNRIIMGLMVAALLVASSLICTTDMWPQIFSIPALGAIGYFIALILGVWLFIYSRKSNK